jgi:catechol 2,3-dioxygenase-like lactoylglutathione lyase family enzyme
MGVRIRNVAFDCRDPVALAKFWAAALGWEVADWSCERWASAQPPSPGAGPRLYFEPVPEPKRGKNRLHLCLEPDGPPADELARLQALGAGKLREVRNDEGERWLVLQDPEGNELCLTIVVSP